MTASNLKKSFHKAVMVILGISGVLVSIFLLLFLLTAGEYTVPKTVAEDPSIPHVTINGVTFHAEAFGNPANPTVIVVHGGPGWDYRSLLALKDLSDKFYVVFYDQRGTGLSPRVNPQELSLESSLMDLDSIVDHFSRGKKVNLIGHSWGGMLVSGYLGRHPQKVSRAVLAEPGFLTSEMAQKAGVRLGPRWEIGFLLRATRDWFRSLHVDNRDGHAASDYFLGQVGPYANPEYYCNGVVPEIGARHWRVGSQAMQAVMRSAMDSDGNMHINLVEGIDQFKRPVFILASECNRLIGKDYQTMQMKFFPNAKLIVIRGSGHMMLGEQPVESIRVVREYLNSPECVLNPE